MEPGGNPPVCNPPPVDTRAPNNKIDTVIIIHSYIQDFKQKVVKRGEGWLGLLPRNLKLHVHV